jgi:hypothetical protein
VGNYDQLEVRLSPPLSNDPTDQLNPGNAINGIMPDDRACLSTREGTYSARASARAFIFS